MTQSKVLFRIGGCDEFKRRRSVGVHVALTTLLAMCALATGAAQAADFPVSGTISVNGNGGALPDNGVFGGSDYDPVTGTIAAGAFVFPQATISFPTSLGNLVVTYVLGQTNTSAGQVASDGIAVLGNAAMRLEVVHATLSGFPIDVGTCVLAPIDVLLAGNGSAAGLDLAAQGFTIPSVAPSDCAGNGDAINSAIAGSNNAMQVHMSGDFTPPLDSDTIFVDGFDGGVP